MDEKRLPFLEHLYELRNRLMWSTVVVALCIVVCFPFAQYIFDFIAAPLVYGMKDSPSLHIQTPTEVFFVYLKLSLAAGLILAAPYLLYQIWMFVAPGLYKRERRIGAAFVFFGTGFFLVGIAFAYYIVLPFGFAYLLGYAYEREHFSILEAMAKVYHLEVDYSQAQFARAIIKPTIMMEKYISIVTKLLLAFGLVFELPLVLYFLAKVGLVDHRKLWKFFRYWIVIAFLLAAVLTPPDLITQAMMAAPLIVMYLSGIVVAWVVTVRRERREAREAREMGYADDDEDYADDDEEIDYDDDDADAGDDDADAGDAGDDDADAGDAGDADDEAVDDEEIDKPEK